MTKMYRIRVLLTSTFLFMCFLSCNAPADKNLNTLIFVNSRIIVGNGTIIQNGMMIVQDGVITEISEYNDAAILKNSTVIDLAGKTIMPGLINAHGHIGDVKALKSGNYSADNILDQLKLNARYGVTTTLSLGGDGVEALKLKEAQDSSNLNYSRIYIAGAVVTGSTPEEAIAVVDANASIPTDFIKIRVDDNLGTTDKMSPEIYRAVIDRSHELGLPLAAHLFYLEDAKSLLNSGADFVAHSIRDQSVDAEVINLLKSKDVCYCPTLTREVSTFVYESTPDFFNDPFFINEVEQDIMNTLNDPGRQQKVKDNKNAQLYKLALDTAMMNLKQLSDAGVKIAFGTDSGPPARFQGYFEHLELELMVKAGLTPMQAIIAATGQAAECIGLQKIGTLENGKWADFIVLSKNPLENILNTRSIESVWIAGNQVPEKK